MIKHIITAATITIASSSFATNLGDVKIGERINGSIEAGPNKIQLPTGEWIIVQKTTTIMESTTSGQIPTINAVLAQVKNKQLSSFLRIRSTLKEMSAPGGWKDDPCGTSLKNIYIKDMLGSSYKYPKCLHTAPILAFLQNPTSSYWKDTSSNVAKLVSRTPKTVIYTDYADYNRGGYIQFSAWHNPEFSQIQDDKIETLENSQWNPENPAESIKPYITTINDWSTSLAYAFKNPNPDGYVAIPPIPFTK